MIYIKTSIDSKEIVIEKMANHIGITSATSLVNNWFSDYSEFIYEDKYKGLTFFKKRSAGYWESDDRLLENYRPV